MLEITRQRTAGDDDEEAQRKDCAHANLLLELHLESRYHCDGQADDDDVGEDVDWFV